MLRRERRDVGLRLGTPILPTIYIYIYIYVYIYIYIYTSVVY